MCQDCQCGKRRKVNHVRDSHRCFSVGIFIFGGDILDENEVVKLDVELDSADLEKTLEKVTADTDALREMLEEIGAEIAKILSILQKSLEKATVSVELLTQALGKATEAVDRLIQSFSAEKLTAGLAEAEGEISGVFENLIEIVATAFAELLAVEWGPVLLKGMDMVAKGLLSIVDEMLGCHAGIAAIITAIAVVLLSTVAVISNWDKISSAVQTFVNETLPQVWGQLSQWVQKVSASVMAVLNQALNTMTELAVACWNQVTSLWSGLCAWLQSAVFQPLTEGVTGFWEWIKQLLGSVTQTVSDVVYNLGVMLSGCWDVFTKAAELGIAAIQEGLAQFCDWIYANVAVPLGDLLSGVWNGFVNGAKAAWEGVKAVFAKVAEFFANTFRTAWQGIVNVFSVAGEIFTDIKDGVFAAFKAIVNSLITGINAVVKIPFDAINRALQTMRTVEIFSMTPFAGLRAITVPQIPYLAKGAVLPANQPFLAVVGDQKHGTNVEAPLATIQEAVAVVLDEQLSALMAGFNATVQEIRKLREDVGNIRVGDEVIYRAAERYREKRAVMYGTPL